MDDMRTIVTLYVLFAMLAALPSIGFAQPPTRASQTFSGIEMMIPEGKKVDEADVRVVLSSEGISIISEKDGTVMKRWNNADIRSAEYSYTKNPRWKSGLGLGAAGFLFPPLWLVAIPLGFTKHRRHWLTVTTETDYAVLRLNKNVRKIFMPAFETSTGVKIAALGDDK